MILDSVLGGHDDWVTSIKWAGRGCVVTASMDRTVSVWLPERTTDVWTHAVRLWGVPGALLGGSGAGGFYAVAVAPGGGTEEQKYMLAFAVNGCFGTIVAWQEAGFQPPAAEIARITWQAIRAVKGRM